MPFSYSIEPEKNLLRQRLWGTIVMKDLRDFVTTLRRDPLLRSGLNVLADLREAQIEMKYDEMLEYTQFLTGSREIGRQAIVVARQLEYGMARMYQQLTEHSVQRADLKVFMDMDEAEQWVLGVVEE